MSKSGLEWDDDAVKRINKAPFFVRKIAKKKVEAAAHEQGLSRITLEFIEKIKKQEMGE